MNRSPIVIIIFVVMFFKSGYSQARLRSPGIYEVGDTTIEVYNWKDPYAIREFKIINGTETILYRSFNRLTKKLQEEGAFKGGYSSGMWKFYGWTGRLKKEINYDNKVKTCYEKKVELNPEELFDFAKFKEDSIFVDKIRRQKMLAAKKNVIHDTVYIVKPSTLPKGKTTIASQATSVKTAEPAKASPTPAPATPEKKEVPAAAATQPAAVKTAEPVKAAPIPAQATSVKKETPAAAATQPAAIKTTEPVKAAPNQAQATSVKKETPAAVATQPAAVKTDEPVKAAPTPAQATSVKKEAPAAVATQPAAKIAEPAKASPTPVQLAPVKKETPAAVVTQPTAVKKDEPQKAAANPLQPIPVKKETPAAVSTQPSEGKKIETTKTSTTPKSESIKKKTLEKDTKVGDDKKKGVETEPIPAKQQSGAALIEQQEEKQQEVSEEKMIALSDDQKEGPEVETTPLKQETEAPLLQQQVEKQLEASEEKKVTATIDIQKKEQPTEPDSVQQEPAEAVIKKTEDTRKPINQNHYYGCRTNGSWCEISNFKPNEFMMRYDVSTEDKTHFSFFEFAVDSMGKLKKEKMIERVSDLKKQSLLKLQVVDSLALSYGMLSMDKPFCHVLEYAADSTQIGNARFQLYISGMPYNKKMADNKITEPFDFIVLDPWTGELINKGNGNAVTDVDNELSIRMTTLTKNQDVQ